MMTALTVAEAQSRLPELIDRALSGEPVTIARDEDATIELRVVPRLVGRRVTRADVERWDALRVRPSKPITDSATLIRQMRDED